MTHRPDVSAHPASMICMALALSVLVSHSCRAQVTPAAAAESAFRRAERLAGGGNTAAARVLIDSVLSTSREGSPEYADAIYWRATLAQTAEQARRDYLRLAVEFSFSPRAEDALLRLAQLELARGDRTAARRHLERLALEHPSGASSAKAAYWMGRVFFEEGAMSSGCTSLAEARSRAAGADVELLNQISYYARQCASGLRSTDAASADSVVRAGSVAKVTTNADSVARKAPSRPPGPPRLSWSVQVAAYSTEGEAERLAARFKARGFPVRVTHGKPFRVRIGRFLTRTEAMELTRKLKDANVTAIVVEAENP